MPRGKLGEDRIERPARAGGIEAAQHVVGAEFEDDAVGAVGERPIEPRKAVFCRIAGDAGIDDADVIARLAQRFFQYGGEGGVGRQKVARRQAVAESDDLERLGERLGGRCPCAKPENRRN